MEWWKQRLWFTVIVMLWYCYVAVGSRYCYTGWGMTDLKLPQWLLPGFLTRGREPLKLLPSPAQHLTVSGTWRGQQYIEMSVRSQIEWYRYIWSYLAVTTNGFPNSIERKIRRYLRELEEACQLPPTSHKAITTLCIYRNKSKNFFFEWRNSLWLLKMKLWMKSLIEILTSFSLGVTNLFMTLQWHFEIFWHD